MAGIMSNTYKSHILMKMSGAMPDGMNIKFLPAERCWMDEERRRMDEERRRWDEERRRMDERLEAERRRTDYYVTLLLESKDREINELKRHRMMDKVT